MKKVISALLALSGVFALEFQPIGFEAVGMGGAGVANAIGSASIYYNPALLAYNRYTAEFSLDAGVGVREINLIDHINNLANKYHLTQTIDHIANNAPISGSNTASGDNIRMQKALEEIYKLSNGNGLDVVTGAYFSTQISSFSVGAYLLSELGANAVIDREHLYLIFANDDGYYYYKPKEDLYGATDKDTYERYSLEYALDNDLTYINVNGVALMEVPVAYAKSFDIANMQLSIGTTLKYINGITYKSKISLDSDDNELQKSLDNNQKSSSNFGIDIGLLAKADKLKIGIVGKYLNSPAFDYYDGSKYRVKPMVRTGIALDLTDYMTFAMDIDLTENDTSISDYKSQYIGGGFNIYKSWFSIRMGGMRNMLQDEEGVILTAGLGIGLKWIQLDISGEASTKSGTYDGNDIPRYFKLNAALISRWGGD
jgi:hypothetical protein